MKNATKFGLILLGLTLLVIGLIDVTRVEPIDWNRSYNQRHKIPYGLYVAHAELSHILGSETRIEEFSNNTYPHIRDLLAEKKETSLIYIVDYFDTSSEVVNELLSFTEQGGEVFISANDFYNNLLDTLGVEQDFYYPKTFGDVFDFEDRPFSLNDGTTAYYKDLEYPGLFYALDSSNINIIGYYEVEGKQLPNFIEVKHGKGRFLLHLEPLMFTNYYMLQWENYIYAAATLKLAQNKNIIWYDDYYQTDEVPETPLRVLLLNDGLRQAWYILLFSLILFLLFKSKRESRAVEIVEPEPNLSKEFAKTIATLYYETGNPGNLVHKKIEYFLYDLRTQYQLDILKLEDEDFAKHLSMRSGTPLADSQQLIAMLIDGRKRRSFTDRELMAINQTIEEFKNKANML